VFNKRCICFLKKRRKFQFIYYYFYMVQQPLVVQGLFIIEASRSHSYRHTALSRTPLDEWSARRRELYLTTHNTHKRQTSMPLAGFEPTISASERPQFHTFRSRDHWDRLAHVTGFVMIQLLINLSFCTIR
jgi:hypothetical protein